jgi:hypothetical protein
MICDHMQPLRESNQWSQPWCGEVISDLNSYHNEVYFGDDRTISKQVLALNKKSTKWKTRIYLLKKSLKNCKVQESNGVSWKVLASRLPAGYRKYTQHSPNIVKKDIINSGGNWQRTTGLIWEAAGEGGTHSTPGLTPLVNTSGHPPTLNPGSSLAWGVGWEGLGGGGGGYEI